MLYFVAIKNISKIIGRVMNLKFTFRHRNKDSKVFAVLRFVAGGTMAHLGIGLSAQDEEQGTIKQRINVDVVLDTQFHLLIDGMDGDQANEFAGYLLDHSDLKTVKREIVWSKRQDGKNTSHRVIDVPGQSFDTVFKALLAAVPVLAPLVEDLKSVDHPLWQIAYNEKNPFFGSASHRGCRHAGKEGVLFDFEQLSLWIANDGQNPEHWIFFKDSAKTMKFVLMFPANNGGGTMHAWKDATALEFSAPVLANQPLRLENTVNLLLSGGFLSIEEARKLATHQSLLGNGKRTLDMRPLIGTLRAKQLSACR